MQPGVREYKNSVEKEEDFYKSVDEQLNSAINNTRLTKREKADSRDEINIDKRLLAKRVALEYKDIDILTSLIEFIQRNKERFTVVNNKLISDDSSIINTYNKGILKFLLLITSKNFTIP